MQINVNLTSLAVILWSGMLIVAGSIWVLCAQVRKVADVLEEHSRRAAPAGKLSAAARPSATARLPRTATRGGVPATTRRAGRAVSAWSRN